MATLATIPGGLRWLIVKAGTAIGIHLASQLDLTQELDLDLPLRKCVVEWKLHAGSDTGTTSLHMLNFTGDDIDDTWTSADFLSWETAFLNQFWANVTGLYAPTTGPEAFHWYHPTLEPRDGGGFDEISGPAVRTRDLAGAFRGTGGGPALPPSSAVSVTLKTPARRHWGRFYLPAPSTVAMNTDGQLGVGSAEAIALRMGNAFEACEAASGLVPVVVSRSLPGAFQVTQVQVDTIFDVIRRRRSPNADGYGRFASTWK